MKTKDLKEKAEADLYNDSIEEEKDIVKETGPTIPNNWEEVMQERELLAKKKEQEMKNLITGTYKRPRRQRAPEPLHPADERRLQIENARNEQEQKENQIRQQMR